MSQDINELLSRSKALEDALIPFIALRPYDESDRIGSSRILCSIALEHAESAKLLIVAGNFTSATGLFRLQYDALVKATWLLYAAPESAVSKLMRELTQDVVKSGEKVPPLGEMIESLEGKAPPEPIAMLKEFKEYSWRPLSSFVHGGIHAVNRHSKGYPVGLMKQVLKASNGVSIMVGMLLIILSGDLSQKGKIPKIQTQFADCLPEPKADEEARLKGSNRFVINGAG